MSVDGPIVLAMLPNASEALILLGFGYYKVSVV